MFCLVWYSQDNRLQRGDHWTLTNLDMGILFAFNLPSSFVLSVNVELFGPSPTEVKAKTWNSYSVYFRRPVTVFVKVVPLISSELSDPAEPFLLKNSLNPLIIPLLESAGGSCQLAVILVEETAVTVKLSGGWKGTEIQQQKIWMSHAKLFISVVWVLVLQNKKYRKNIILFNC